MNLTIPTMATAWQKVQMEQIVTPHRPHASDRTAGEYGPYSVVLLGASGQQWRRGKNEKGGRGSTIDSSRSKRERRGTWKIVVCSQSM